MESIIKRNSAKIKAKIESYFDSFWNRMDIILLGYFLVMMCVRFGVVACFAEDEYKGGVNTSLNVSSLEKEKSPPTPPQPPSRPLMSAGRTRETNLVFVLNMYSLYFVFWCLRLLQLFAVSASLGPKLIMIRLMIDDVLKIFLYIMIFAIAYAVWLKVAMKTVSKDFMLGGKAGGGGDDDSPSFTETIVDMFLSVNGSDVVYFLDDLLEHPFWHLFGESFLESYDKFLPMRNDTGAYAYDYRVMMILLMAPLMRIVYVLISVVLLLNLMIAIFQYSIDLVQTQADRNWNIYRKAVIFEYHNRAILPAPLSLVLDVGILLSLFYRKCRGSSWHPTIVSSSERFECSTLKMRVNGTKSEVNPFAKWLEYIKQWEKTLQMHHTFVGVVGGVAMIGREASGGGGAASGGGGGGTGGEDMPVKETVSSEAMGIIEIKDEMKKLQLEVLKLTRMSSSGRLHPRNSTALKVDKKSLALKVDKKSNAKPKVHKQATIELLYTQENDSD